MFQVPHDLSNDLQNEEILVKSRIHFFNSFFVKDFVNDRRMRYWSENLQKNCLWQCNKPYDLKSSIRSSFSKTRSKNSLLGQLRIAYIPSIASSTSNMIVRALNVSNCSTSAGGSAVQPETKYYLLKHLLTQ